jgi:hypothetical protein
LKNWRTILSYRIVPKKWEVGARVITLVPYTCLGKHFPIGTLGTIAKTTLYDVYVRFDGECPTPFDANEIGIRIGFPLDRTWVELI